MRLLVIGGTKFVGRHFVERATSRGHELTLFNRGESNPGLFDSVEEIHGDRDGGLDRLAGGKWDAVIDTCGYIPRVVRASAEFLSGSVGRYVFVSSVSAYRDFTKPGLTEDSPLGEIDDPETEEITDESYGPLKALSESVVRDVYGAAALIVRPGLIVGPHDPTDRFTYWPHRIDRGGDVLAPSPADARIQFIDVRDLAAFMVDAIESSLGGSFNAVTEPGAISFGDLLETCQRVTGSDADLVWADADALVEAGVEPWMELPVWVPESDRDFAYMMHVSSERAVAAGFTFTPIEETVRATLEWDRARAVSELTAGLAPAREAELLAVLRG